MVADVFMLLNGNNFISTTDKSIFGERQTLTEENE